ncbi:FecR domain-containing protein [Pseudomonas sp. 5P_3.1_Bac2]|uniref:FecR domain-containing protein n=1 Tax=Pseudomonas sp. 5P_3.1_Bac2 TaxID=2971617 RepID=UPI0021C7895A|nr:FecR family protein [Pseudomonas sp. 5P_3.1_Bac2]MCU1717716.1 FecR family protein [Pseudomonas sp. 5P_3.1_Bac2]
MSRCAAEAQIIDEAAQWLALLQSGAASAQEQLAFTRWRDGDPRRAEVFQRMNASLSTFSHDDLRRLPRDNLLQSLNAPSGRRRFLRNSLGVLGLVAGSGWLLRNSAMWPSSGTLRTATGERLTTTLADGSALTLAPRSQVLAQIDGHQRLLQLRAGQLLLEVATDRARPFVLVTAEGQVQAWGHRLLMRERAGQTQITALTAEAQIITANGSRQVLRAGQQASFSANRIDDLQAVDATATAWTQGLLEVRDRSLGEVVETLRDYRPGIIRISPEAARLRLSGIFPLDDTSRTLHLLSKSLPVRIRYHSAYWVSIELA